MAFGVNLHVFLRSTQAASNLGSLSARQRNAIWIAFRWRADSCPISRALFGIFYCVHAAFNFIFNYIASLCSLAVKFNDFSDLEMDFRRGAKQFRL